MKTFFRYFHQSSLVKIERGAKIGRGVRFSGRCFIGASVIIEDNVMIRDSKIVGSCTIKRNSILEACIIQGKKNIIGPVAYCREVQINGGNNIIGFCAEVARSVLADEVKISHHSFVGDAIIEDSVIIGAGAITANYRKGVRYRTHLKENTLVGCNVTIIAPFVSEIGELLPAGSVVKSNVRR